MNGLWWFLKILGIWYMISCTAIVTLIALIAWFDIGKDRMFDD